MPYIEVYIRDEVIKQEYRNLEKDSGLDCEDIKFLINHINTRILYLRAENNIVEAVKLEEIINTLRKESDNA